MTDVDDDKTPGATPPSDDATPTSPDGEAAVDTRARTKRPVQPMRLVDIEHDDSLQPRLRPTRAPIGKAFVAAFDRVAAMPAEGWVTLAVVVGCSLFMFLAVHPNLIFRANTPTGGDMGAHVIGPKFLVDHLLPHGRLTGWSPDWFAGFPLYGFYMVVPAFAIAVLFAGLRSWVLAPALVGSLAVLGAGWFVPRLWRWRWHLSAVGALLVLWALPMPYGVGFKIITVAGLITLPISAWAFAKLADLRFPAPPLFAVAALLYLANREPTASGIGNLIGGNMASTMAGEYSFSIALSISLVYFGVLARGFKTGKHRALAAVLLALVGLCHLLPFFFALLATVVMLAVQFRPKRALWLAPVVVTAGLLASFWMLPFVANRALTNDMGWDKLPYPGLHLTNYLLPQHLLWIAALAVVGLVAAVLYRNRTGYFLVGAVVATALAVCLIPQAQLWNARILPFYYLSMFFLAAFGVAAALRLVADVAARLEGGFASMRTLFVASAALSGFAYVRYFTVRPWPHGAAAPTLAHSSPGRFLRSVGQLLSYFFRHGSTAHNRNEPAILVFLFCVGVLGMLFAGTEGRTRAHVFRVRLPGLVATPVFVAVVMVMIAFPLHVLPGRTTVTKHGKVVTNKQGTPQQSWLGFKSFDQNNMVAWAQWNYTGYEGKQGVADPSTGKLVHGWPEYHALMQTMGHIGAAHGCGRALWEQDNTVEGDYGTPMALMLLPYWTKSCVTSEEGLYFESSSTTPYHWLLAAEASATPSDPQRNLPYESMDLAKAVPHMQLMGVKYYLAESASAVAAADKQPDLTKIATSGPWQIYQVQGSSPVEGLDYLPAVWDRGPAQHSWLMPAISWFNDPGRWQVPFAADGPSNWPRVHTDSRNWSSAWAGLGIDVQSSFGTTTPALLPLTPRHPVRKAQVSHLHMDTDSISFDVDKPGTPVLIRTSYFPNWKASGAHGPYRVTPNFMVVVPTSTHVHLTYGRTGTDWAAIVMTLLGLGGVVVLCRLAPVAVGTRRRRTPRVLQRDELPDRVSPARMSIEVTPLPGSDPPVD